MQETNTINSRAYWDQRFDMDWDQRGGPDQSRFFASILLDWLSSDFKLRITQKGWSICDWGCAEGDGTALLAAAFPRSKVSGTDLASTAIMKAAERYPNIAFRVSNANDLSDASDVIVTSNVLEHLDDPWGNLAKLAPLARQAIVVLVPFLDTTGEPEHVQVFRPLDIREALDEEMYLTEAIVIDTSIMPQTRWPGLQLLAVYQRFEEAISNQTIRSAASEIATLQKMLLAIDYGGIGPTGSWPPAWQSTSFRKISTQINRARELSKQNEMLTKQRREIEEKLINLEGQFAKERQEISSLKQDIKSRDHRVVELETIIQAVQRSTSWRITRPLRAAMRLARGTMLRRRVAAADIVAKPNEPTEPAIKNPLGLAIATAPFFATSSNSPHGAPKFVENDTAPVPLVAMLVSNFDVGGVERFVVDLSKRLGNVGLPCAVFTTGKVGRLAEEALRAGIPVYSCSDSAAVASAARKLNIRLVVAHHCTIGWEELHTNGVPIVEVLHNLYHWQRGDITSRSLRKFVSRFIAVSLGVQEFAVQHLGVLPQDIMHVANGMDPSVFLRPRREVILALRNKTEYVFIQPAQIWAAKCHHSVLTAFEKLHREFPHTRLVIAGSVGDTDVYTRLIDRIEALGLKSAVEIAGNLDRRQLSHRYAQANAMLLPSILEGFSIATLEGLYFGLPMILTDIGGASEVIKDEDVGILVPPPFIPSELTPERARAAGASDNAGHADLIFEAMRRMVGDRHMWQAKGLEGMIKFPTFDMSVVAQRYEVVLTPLLTPASIT